MVEMAGIKENNKTWQAGSRFGYASLKMYMRQLHTWFHKKLMSID